MIIKFCLLIYLIPALIYAQYAHKGLLVHIEKTGASWCKGKDSGASCFFAPFQELAQRRFQRCYFLIK
jgi:hypothetical protein